MKMARKTKEKLVSKPIGAPQGSALPPHLLKSKKPPKVLETPIYEHRLMTKEQYPPRPRTAIPDPYAELSEEVKAQFGLWPYDSNIIIDKRQLVELQDFFLNIREIPLPSSVIHHFESQHNIIRKILQLVPLEDIESLSKPGEKYVGPKTYKCRCYKSKK